MGVAKSVIRKAWSILTKARVDVIGYREVAGWFAFVASIVSFFYPATAGSSASPAAYHVILTALYAVTLPYLEEDRSESVTLEIVVIQLFMIMFYLVDEDSVWQYLFYPIMTALFMLVATFHPDNPNVNVPLLPLPSLNDVWNIFTTT